jgi:hypothetical protein
MPKNIRILWIRIRNTGKSDKEVTKRKKSRFSFFLHDDERIRSRSWILIRTCDKRTNGSGFPTLPDPQGLPVGAAECGWAGAGPHVVHQLAHTPQLTLVAAGGKATFTSFSKIISQKEVTEQQESRFF